MLADLHKPPVPDSSADSIHERALAPLARQVRDEWVSTFFRGPHDKDNFTLEDWEKRNEYLTIMLKEPAVSAAFWSLIASVMSLPLKAHAADPDDERDVYWSNFARDAVSSVAGGAPKLIANIACGGVLFGYGASELVFDFPERGKWRRNLVLRECAPLDSRYIRFDLDPFKRVVGVRGIKANGGQVFGPDRFAIFSHQSLFGSPFGISRFRPAYRAAKMLESAIKLRLILIQNYSGPFLAVKAANATTRETAMRVLPEARSLGYLVCDKNDEIAVLNMASGSDSEFQSAIEDLRKEMYTAIRWGYLPFTEASSGVQVGNSEVQRSMTQLGEWMLATEVANVITEQIVKPLIRLNCPDEDVGFPTITLGGQNNTDKKSAGDIFELGKRLNVPLSKRQVQRALDLEEPSDKEDTLVDPATMGGNPFAMPGAASGGGMPPMGPDAGGAPVPAGGPDAGGDGDGGGDAPAAPVNPLALSQAKQVAATTKPTDLDRAATLAVLDLQARATMSGHPGRYQRTIDSLRAMVGHHAITQLAELQGGSSSPPPDNAFGWMPARTRTGHVKAVGTGEHLGKTLYGPDAEGVLRPKEVAKSKPATENEATAPSGDKPNGGGKILETLTPESLKKKFWDNTPGNSGVDIGKLSQVVRDHIRKAKSAGHEVLLRHPDMKEPISIDGDMKDSQGQAWGLIPVLTDATGKARIDIREKVQAATATAMPKEQPPASPKQAAQKAASGKYTAEDLKAVANGSHQLSSQESQSAKAGILKSADNPPAVADLAKSLAAHATGEKEAATIAAQADDKPKQSRGKAAEILHAQLQSAPGLTDEHRQTYGAAVDRVTQAMPAKAHERVAANLKGGATFHADTASIAGGVMKDVMSVSRGERHDAIRQKFADLKGQKFGAGYAIGSGRIHIDGGKDGGSPHEIYAHTLGHVLDGPGFEISNSDQWWDAFTSEIAENGTGKHKLSKHASTAPEEGFAEFSRLLYGSGAPASTIAEKFPRSVAVFRSHGLLPDGFDAKGTVGPDVGANRPAPGRSTAALANYGKNTPPAARSLALPERLTPHTGTVGLTELFSGKADLHPDGTHVDLIGKEAPTKGGITDQFTAAHAANDHLAAHDLIAEAMSGQHGDAVKNAVGEAIDQHYANGGEGGIHGKHAAVAAALAGHDEHGDSYEGDLPERKSTLSADDDPFAISTPKPQEDDEFPEPKGVTGADLLGKLNAIGDDGKPIRKPSAKPTDLSLHHVVAKSGGIDPTSPDFLKHFEGVNEAVEYGIPRTAFRMGGRDPQELAKELHNEGHIAIPDFAGDDRPDGDYTEHLFNQLATGAKSLHSEGNRFEQAEAENARREQDEAESRSPWKLTKAEFLKQHAALEQYNKQGERNLFDDDAMDAHAAEAQALFPAAYDAQKAPNPSGGKYSPEDAHRRSVMQAVKEGRSVPANVLKDYPDLAPAKAAVATTATLKVGPTEPRAKGERGGEKAAIAGGEQLPQEKAEPTSKVKTVRFNPVTGKNEEQEAAIPAEPKSSEASNLKKQLAENKTYLGLSDADKEGFVSEVDAVYSDSKIGRDQREQKVRKIADKYRDLSKSKLLDSEQPAGKSSAMVKKLTEAHHPDAQVTISGQDPDEPDSELRIHSIKLNGRAVDGSGVKDGYRYYIRRHHGAKTYSFDGGQTWAVDKDKAFENRIVEKEFKVPTTDNSPASDPPASKPGQLTITGETIPDAPAAKAGQQLTMDESVREMDHQKAEEYAAENGLTIEERAHGGRFKMGDGTATVGRHIPSKQVPIVLKNLGIQASGVQHDVKGTFDKLRTGQAQSVKLSNGWKLSPSRVQNERRIEVEGLNPYESREFEQLGGIKHRIGWDTRHFLPIGDNGHEIMDRILKARNAVITDVNE